MGGGEIVLIIFIALLFFGSKAIPDVAYQLLLISQRVAIISVPFVLFLIREVVKNLGPCRMC